MATLKPKTNATSEPPLDASNAAAKQWLAAQKPLAGRGMRLAIGLHALAAWLIIAQTGLFAHILHSAAFEQASLAQLTPFLWILLAVIVLRSWLLNHAEQRAFEAASRIKQALRTRLLDHLFALGPVLHKNWQSAHVSQMLYEGIESLDDYYARYLPTAALCAFLPLGILLLVLPMDWKSGLIFLFTAPLIPFFMILVGSKAEALNQARWKSLTRLGNHFFDRIRGLHQLKLFNAAEREISAVQRMSDGYREATISVLKVAFLSSFALEFLATVSIAMVAVIVGFRLYWGSLDFATGLWLLLLAPEFYGPFRQLGVHYHARMAGISAANDMRDFLHTPPQTQGDELAPPTGSCKHLSLKSVCFGYDKEHPVLKNLSIDLRGPGLYAIVGESGAGKSTLMQIILGFLRPDTGQYQLAQQNTKSLSTAAIQSALAWLPQCTQLFYASVAENIQLGRSGATTSDIQAAARAAGADSFIRALPQGYDTLIGDGGQGLSGGQAQRLSLARALLKDAPILLLDEPTRHLDHESEQHTLSILKQYAKKHMVIVIAQRFHTLTQADEILVLQQGRLTQRGTHKTLSQVKGEYQRLLNGGDHE